MKNPRYTDAVSSRHQINRGGFIVKNNNFFDLADHLRELLKSVPYSESTYKDMDFIIRSFENYMRSNDLAEYSPELGEKMVSYCENELHVCASRVSRAKGIVTKLNQLYHGHDGHDALWPDQTAEILLPDELQSALDSYLNWCKANGNKDTTIRYRRWICSRFLKNLADLGCSGIKDLNGENIQAAFIRLKYSRYWERIGPFLRFLYEQGKLQHNYSHLMIHRKVSPPQPTTYSVEEVAAIEASVDRTIPSGIRNYAMLLLMSRYGIRSRDVAALTFENLDFDKNRISFIQQKTGEPWECELFQDVKEALLDYIQNVRPKDIDCRQIFIKLVIPYKPLDGLAINTAIWTLLKKSGVDISDRRHGGRALRSSITSNLIKESVPTEIVRKVLGHGTRHAIKSYARIDIESLRLCPIPVAEPSGTFASLLHWKAGEE